MWWELVLGIGVFLTLIGLGRTRWSKKEAQRRNLTTAAGGPSGSALWTAVLLAVAGVVIAVTTGNWMYLVLLGAAAAVGVSRYVAYRRSGIWR